MHQRKVSFNESSVEF